MQRNPRDKHNHQYKIRTVSNIQVGTWHNLYLGSSDWIIKWVHEDMTLLKIQPSTCECIFCDILIVRDSGGTYRLSANENSLETWGGEHEIELYFYHTMTDSGVTVLFILQTRYSSGTIALLLANNNHYTYMTLIIILSEIGDNKLLWRSTINRTRYL